MDKTTTSGQGTIRFLIFVIGILALLNIGYHLTWNRPEDMKTNLSWPDISVSLAFSGINSPTHIAAAGDGSKRLFITEQRGRVLVIKNGVLQKRPFLDISGRVSCCGERGLLSIVFPPGFGNKKYFYLNYTDRNGATVVARYRVSADADAADPRTEEIVLTVEQPFANHNGGQLAFGPDGYLYIGMGDGGSAGDPHNHAQNPSSLLGKMLRIDVESGKRPYAIPQDNPFIETKGYRPEIWATGLRNPWRFSFDRKTGDLYIADVGQDRYEEINIEPKGGKGGRNYGWNIMEGMHCYETENCDRSRLTGPVAEYGHSDGCSVTGGMVYRGEKFSQMHGVYFYGDFCSGKIWGLRQSGGEWTDKMLRDSGLSISTFGEDEAGELYLADYGRGNIYRITASR